MLKALILSSDNELVENIKSVFRRKIAFEQIKRRNYSDYNIFIFDETQKDKINNIIENLKLSSLCIININSDFIMENQHNLKKPFRIVKLLSIIQDFLDSSKKNLIFLRKNISFNVKDRIINIDDNSVFLTEKENELLYFLYKNGKSPKKEILQKVWRRENTIDDNGVLERIIYNLRQKLKDFVSARNLILSNDNYCELGE
jgi:hypothetical protein